MKKAGKSTMSMVSEAMRDLLPYTNLGWQLVATMLVFFGAGYLIDRWMDTGDTMKILFALLGIFVGLYTFFKSVQQLQDKRKKPSP
jgi:F0F1-type ATP synthase assembly protein I